MELFFRDLFNGSEESPLVGMGLELFVDEDAVSFGARSFLQGEGNEISEAAAWEGVLIWEEAVVRGELGLGAAFGGFGEEVGGEFSDESCGDGFFEEEPDVCAVSGAGSFQGGWDFFFGASGEVGEGVVSPAVAVEIDCEEMAGFVEKHGVNPDDEIAGEVAADDFIGDGEPVLMGAGVAFDTRFLANATHPFVAADRGVSGLAGLLADEAMGVDFFTTTKKRAEEVNLFRCRRGVTNRHGSFGFYYFKIYPQHFLCFFPLPQGQGELRLIFGVSRFTGVEDLPTASC